jgi:predicted permease
MLALPALAFVVASLGGATPDVLRVAVLESAMPPMVTAGALAAAAGLAPELAAALVGYGILLSLVTLPVIHALLP